MGSVLPWVILFRVVRQEEDAFRSLCHQQQLQSPADEGAGARGRLSPVCIRLRARVGSGAGSFLEGGSGGVCTDWVAGQGRGLCRAPHRVRGASPVQSGAQEPRATGLSWLGARAARGRRAQAPLCGCDHGPGRRPHPLWGQWRISGSPEGSRSSGVAAAARAGPAQAALRAGLRGEQGLHWLALEPGQLLWTRAQRARLEQNSSSVTFGQDCLFLYQVDFILRFPCIFSINLT